MFTGVGVCVGNAGEGVGCVWVVLGGVWGALRNARVGSRSVILTHTGVGVALRLCLFRQNKQGARLKGHALGGYRSSPRSEEHTSELQSRRDLVCRLLLEKKKKNSRKKIDSRERID